METNRAFTSFGGCFATREPYRARLILGVVALALLGMAEGVIALMITPMIDRILTPSSNELSCLW